MKQSDNRGEIIILEGLPGVGKTLLCRSALKHDSKVKVLEEWVDEDMLQKYLKDMKTWAKDFQFKIQDDTILRMTRAVQLAKEGYTVYVDRGIIGNRCFAELQYEAGLISKADIEVYRSSYSYDFIKGLNEVKITVVYMFSTVDHCLERIKRRGRKGEDSYNFDYLSRLKEKHDILLKEAKIMTCDVDHELEEGLMSRETLRRSLEVF